MQEVTNKIEMKFLNKSESGEKKDEPVKPKRRPEEKSALKKSTKTDAKTPVQRVKIAPYAYVEVRGYFFLYLSTNVC